jgi:PAS domain S-box-containing protein
MNSFSHKIVLLSLFVLLFVSPLFSRDKVVVGFYSYYPLTFINDSAKPDGFFIDLIEYIAVKENWPLEYRFGTVSDVMEWLRTGEIDIAAALGYDDARAMEFVYSSEVTLYSETKLYAGRGLDIRKIEDLDGRTVAVVYDDLYYESFRSLTQHIGLNCNFIYEKDYESVLSAVNEGGADSGVVCLLYGLSFEKRYRNIHPVNIQTKPVQISFAAAKNSGEDIIEAIDRDFVHMIQDDRPAYEEMYNLWLKSLVKKHFPPEIKWILVGIGGFLIFLFATLLLLKSQVKRQTLQLVVKNEELEQEIRERQEVEKAVRESENFNASLLSHAPNPIGIIGPDGKIQYVNNATRDVLGYAPQELIGQSMPYSFWPEDIADAIRENFEKGMKSGGRFIFHFKKKTGELFWVDVTISPVFDEGGELKHALTMWLDITERIKIEEDLERRVFERTSQLIAANDELENLNEIVKQLSMTLDFDSVFDKISNFITGIYGFEGCLYLNADMNEKKLVVAQVAAPDDFELDGNSLKGYTIDLSVKDCIVAEAMKNNNSVLVELKDDGTLKQEYEREFFEFFNNYGIKNLLILRSAS